VDSFVQTHGGDAMAKVLHDIGLLLVDAQGIVRVRQFPDDPTMRRSSLDQFLAGLSLSQPVAATQGAELAHKVASTILPLFARQALEGLGIQDTQTIAG
jgi:hypothetical protein